MNETRPNLSQSPIQTAAEVTLAAVAGGDVGGDEFRGLVPGYEIVEELGRGGMGVVYRAWQPALKRFVALKRIRAGDVRPEALDRFRHEAQLVAQLQHPNIVQVYEVGEYTGEDGAAVPFIALEYVDGGSLDAHLRGEPQRPRDA